MGGRTRFTAVDPLGLVWARRVTTADVPDRDGGCGLLGAVRGGPARVREVIADAGFTRRFIDWVRAQCRWNVITTYHAPEGFKIYPRRWVVERSFAWFIKYRRLAKYYERLPKISETIIYAAMIHRMARQLRPASEF